MSVVKSTARMGRMTAAGDCYNPNHNSRDSGIGSHIDRERMCKNRYLVWDENGAREKKSDESFDAHEHKQFKRLFGESLEAQNKRYRKRRQDCRCLTIDQYRRRARSSAEELILQIGNSADAVSGKDLRRAMNEFLNDFVSRYGVRIIPLDLALHLDESSAHAHFRYIYTIEGKDGLEVSQRQALAALGISRPNTDAEETRYNNAKMTFTADVREMWNQAIERSTVYEIDRVPEVSDRSYLSPTVYRLQSQIAEMAPEAAALASECDSLRAEVESLTHEKHRLTGLLRPLRAAVESVGDLFSAFASNPVVARIKSAIDSFCKAYDNMEIDDDNWEELR